MRIFNKKQLFEYEKNNFTISLINVQQNEYKIANH